MDPSTLLAGGDWGGDPRDCDLAGHGREEGLAMEQSRPCRDGQSLSPYIRSQRKVISQMTGKFSIHRYLDPGETLGEVLFGLIMVLTFTVGARLLMEKEGLDARELIVAAVGCNIAWGVIDAVLFMLGALFYRSQRARFYRALRGARNDAEALATVRVEFSLEDEPLAILPEDRARLHQSIVALTAQAVPARAHLLPRDFVGAFVVFALVSATALPGVIPFLLLGDSELALRLSNLVLILLLFVVGYWWAHYTDARPWRVGLSVMLLGVGLVLVAIALGG
jgi:VIT family